MKDPSGNEIPKMVECSMQMQCYVLGSKIDKALWILAHACVNKKNTTKDEMVEKMNEATKLLIEVRQALVGK